MLSDSCGTPPIGSKYFVYSHDIDSHKIHTQSKILHRILHSQVPPILKPAS